MEDFERVQLLARANEFDGNSGYGADGKNRASARVAVELGEYNAAEWQRLMKRVRGVHSVLSGHGIKHEEYFVWLHVVADGAHFLHHLFIDVQTSGGVDDNDIV